jgi:predicted PurR-regulated permease PerM
VALVLVGLVWLLGLTSTITEPVLVGLILATVAGPLVTKMQHRGVPRAAGAALVLLALLVLFGIIVLLVFGGIFENSEDIKTSVSAAVDKVEGWVNDLGAGGTSETTSEAKSGASQTGATLLQGVFEGIQGITSLVFFVTFAIFSTFFLLKDGPSVREFINRNLGVPRPVASTITSNVIRSLRRYFLGVTIVAGFNAIVVGIGALLLDVRLAGTALIMLVIVILANGLLQNIVQPIAFGATLDLNPLAVLIVTIGFGCIFGMIGLILGAPLTSAALHISRELAAARAADALAEAERAPPEAAAAPL